MEIGRDAEHPEEIKSVVPPRVWEETARLGREAHSLPESAPQPAVARASKETRDLQHRLCKVDLISGMEKPRFGQGLPGAQGRRWSVPGEAPAQSGADLRPGTSRH